MQLGERLVGLVCIPPDALAAVRFSPAVMAPAWAMGVPLIANRSSISLGSSQLVGPGVNGLGLHRKFVTKARRDWVLRLSEHSVRSLWRMRHGQRPAQGT